MMLKSSVALLLVALLFFCTLLVQSRSISFQYVLMDMNESYQFRVALPLHRLCCVDSVHVTLSAEADCDKNQGTYLLTIQMDPDPLTFDPVPMSHSVAASVKRCRYRIDNSTCSMDSYDLRLGLTFNNTSESCKEMAATFVIDYYEDEEILSWLGYEKSSSLLDSAIDFFSWFNPLADR